MALLTKNSYVKGYQKNTDARKWANYNFDSSTSGVPDFSYPNTSYRVMSDISTMRYAAPILPQDQQNYMMYGCAMSAGNARLVVGADEYSTLDGIPATSVSHTYSTAAGVLKSGSMTTADPGYWRVKSYYNNSGYQNPGELYRNQNYLRLTAPTNGWFFFDYRAQYGINDRSHTTCSGLHFFLGTSRTTYFNQQQKVSATSKIWKRVDDENNLYSFSYPGSNYDVTYNTALNAKLQSFGGNGEEYYLQCDNNCFSEYDELSGNIAWGMYKWYVNRVQFEGLGFYMEEGQVLEFFADMQNLINTSDNIEENDTSFFEISNIQFVSDNIGDDGMVEVLSRHGTYETTIYSPTTPTYTSAFGRSVGIGCDRIAAGEIQINAGKYVLAIFNLDGSFYTWCDIPDNYINNIHGPGLDELCGIVIRDDRIIVDNGTYGQLIYDIDGNLIDYNSGTSDTTDYNYGMYVSGAYSGALLQNDMRFKFTGSDTTPISDVFGSAYGTGTLSEIEDNIRKNSSGVPIAEDLGLRIYNSPPRPGAKTVAGVDGYHYTALGIEQQYSRASIWQGLNYHETGGVMLLNIDGDNLVQDTDGKPTDILIPIWAGDYDVSFIECNAGSCVAAGEQYVYGASYYLTDWNYLYGPGSPFPQGDGYYPIDCGCVFAWDIPESSAKWYPQKSMFACIS